MYDLTSLPKYALLFILYLPFVLHLWYHSVSLLICSLHPCCFESTPTVTALLFCVFVYRYNAQYWIKIQELKTQA